MNAALAFTLHELQDLIRPPEAAIVQRSNTLSACFVLIGEKLMRTSALSAEYWFRAIHIHCSTVTAKARVSQC